MDKVNNLIKKEISQIIMVDLKDPRVKFVSITDVETTRDLSYAKVYFSVFGDDKKTQKTEEGLLSCAGFIRKLLSTRLEMRHVPELVFKLDKSAEHTMKILEKIEEIKDESKKNR